MRTYPTSYDHGDTTMVGTDSVLVTGVRVSLKAWNTAERLWDTADIHFADDTMIVIDRIAARTFDDFVNVEMGRGFNLYLTHEQAAALATALNNPKEG